MHNAFAQEQVAENAELQANLEKRKAKRKLQPQDSIPEEKKQSSHQQRVDNVVNRLYPGNKIQRNQTEDLSSVLAPDMPIEDSPNAFATFKRFLKSESHSKQISELGFIKLSDLWNRARTAEQCKNLGLSPVIGSYLKLFMDEVQAGKVKIKSNAQFFWGRIGQSIGRIGASQEDSEEEVEDEQPEDGSYQAYLVKTAKVCCAKMRVANPLREFSIADFANLSEMTFPSWQSEVIKTNDETEEDFTDDVVEVGAKASQNIEALKEKIYPSFLLDNAEDENINYNKLMQNIELKHPRYLEKDDVKTTQGHNDKKSFDIFEDVGDLYNLCPTSKTLMIDKVNREIGLGASLFLLTLKALAKFFCVLFVINLPVLYMYSDYQRFLFMTKIKVRGKKPVRDDALGYFAKLSMGNLKYMEKNSPTVNTALTPQETKPEEGPFPPGGPRFGPPRRKLQTKTIVHLGCYWDNVFARAMSLRAQPPGGWDKDKCAAAALKEKSLFFGVQGQGSGCWIARSNTFVAYEKYDKHGKGSGCSNGKGGWSANDVYEIKFTTASSATQQASTGNTKVIGEIKGLGCYNDREWGGSRAMATRLKGGGWNKEKCSQEALSRKSPFFGIEYWGGECFVAKAENYVAKEDPKRYGQGSGCVNGVGTWGKFDLYEITYKDPNAPAAPVLAPGQVDTSGMQIVALGCYTDKPARAMSYEVPWKTSAGHTKDTCAIEAIKLKSLYFGIQGGSGSAQCWMAKSNDWKPTENYATYGRATGCVEGKGGIYKQDVYQIKGLKIDGKEISHAPPAIVKIPTIKITKATWGSGDQQRNIVELVENDLESGTRTFKPDVLKYDPLRQFLKGRTKYLVINYEYDGKQVNKQAREHTSQTITIPEGKVIPNPQTYYCVCNNPGDKGPDKNDFLCDNGVRDACNQNEYCTNNIPFKYSKEIRDGCKVRDTDYCKCNYPGDKTGGKNSFLCTNGQNRYCPSTQYCFTSSLFKIGEQSSGCKERVTRVDCQCQNPGVLVNLQNVILCSDGKINYCDSDSYCFSSAKIISTQKNNLCKKVPITCKCNKPGDIKDNSITCSDGKTTSCASTDYCTNTGSFGNGNLNQACKEKPKPITCKCQRPGDLGQSNGIQCTNGMVTYCVSTDYCFSSATFKNEERNNACKERPPPVTCQCQRPGDYGKDNNIKCTDDKVHQCSETTYCDSKDKFFLYQKDTACKERPYLNQPTKTVDGLIYQGCWFDSANDRAIPNEIKGVRADKKMCQAFATSRGFNTFSLQAGVCFVGQDPDFKKYGASWKCIDGQGSDFSNYVYKIIPIEQRKENLVQLKITGGNLTDATTIFSDTMVKDMISDGKFFTRTCCGKNQGSTCSHTNTAKSGNYIMFNLDKDQFVSQIHLANRDAFPERAYGIKIYANETLCGTWPEHYDVWYNASCPTGTMAKYIKIVQPNPKVLTICGVQVFGPKIVEDRAQFMSTSGFIFFIDVITIFSAFIFFEVLEVRLKSYTKQFLSDTINVHEFTIGVKNIADDNMSKIDLINLRSQLHSYFGQLMKSRVSDEENAEMYQIADITFGTDSIETTLDLVELYNLRMTYLKFKRNGPGSCACIFGDEDSAKKAYDEMELKVKTEMQLYDGENVLPKIAFVTFRSIEAARTILKEFENQDDFACCWSSKATQRVADVNFDEKFQGNRYLQILKVNEPDQIIWTSIPYTTRSKYLRQFVVFIFFGVVLAILLLSQLIIKLTSQKPENAIDCATIPDKKKFYAFNQYMLGDSNPIYCYCKGLMFQAPQKLPYVSFKKMSNGEHDNLCLGIIWSEYGASIATTLINAFVLESLFQLADIEGHEAEDGLSKAKFLSVLRMKLINTIFIVLLINVSWQAANFNDGFSKSFNYMWFQSVGSAFSYTLMMMIFQQGASSFMMPSVNWALRWYDRGFSYRVKKDDHFDDVECNTAKHLQSEINKLYTGDEIQGYKVYANLFLAFMSCMTFSMGMPMLYCFGCLIFFSQFLINKFLLLKYHSKTTMFGQDLALSSVDQMKWALVFHIIFGFINLLGVYEMLWSSHILYIICAAPIFILYMFSSLKDKLLLLLRIKTSKSDEVRPKPADLYKEMKISQLYMFFYRTLTEKNEILENVSQIDPKCYNNEVDNYNKKIKELVKVINGHFDFLVESQEQWLGVATKKIKNLSIRKRLDVLLLNDGVVEEMARIMQKDMLRMQSNIVSYHINDSAQYYLAGQMRNLLEKMDREVNKKTIDFDEDTPQMSASTKKNNFEETAEAPLKLDFTKQ